MSYPSNSNNCPSIKLSSTGQNKIDKLRLIEEKNYKSALNAGDDIGITSWSRYTEHSLKLSILYAASRDCRDMELDDDALRWGGTLALNMIKRQLSMVSDFNYKNDFDEICQKIVQRLKSSGRDISRSSLSNYMRVAPKDLNNAIKGLEDQNRIEMVPKKVNGSTRTTRFYRLKSRK